MKLETVGRSLWVTALVLTAGCGGAGPAGGGEQDRLRELRGQVEIDGVICNRTGAEGTVTNNANVTLDVFIDLATEGFDAKVTLTQAVASARNLEPGETRHWMGSTLHQHVGCRATLGSIRRAVERVAS